MLSFGICSVYSVVVANIIKEVLSLSFEPSVVITFLILPMILLSWIPDLKYLAPVALIASFFMTIALGVTIFELVKGEPAKDVNQFSEDVINYTSFISKCVFSIQAICECRFTTVVRYGEMYHVATLYVSLCGTYVLVPQKKN